MVFHPFNNQFDSADARTLYNARLSLSDIALGFAGNVFGRPRSYGVDVIYSFQENPA